MIPGKTIFISPLDWGLGHATRCVPLIRSLSLNNTVVIGTTDLNADFFNIHFPALQKEELPSYKITYSKYLPLWLKLIMQWPRIRAVIREEKKRLDKLIAQYKIEIVISDNRYGLTHKDVHCIFMTHQLHLKAPFFSFLANYVNRKFIHQFNEVWVPDYEALDLRLSGRLSDPGDIRIPVKYIGPKSALADLGTGEMANAAFDYLVLLSGVEPQRSLLENSLLEKFKTSDKKIVFVRGSDSTLNSQNTNIRIYNFAFGEELKSLIVNAETVICRSGYSSLMDLHLLQKKKLILIPTPGQGEQEYLAKYWKKTFAAVNLPQHKLKHHIFK